MSRGASGLERSATDIFTADGPALYFSASPDPFIDRDDIFSRPSEKRSSDS